MARQPKNHEEHVTSEDPDDIVRQVARRLQEERVRAGISQTALAEMAGLSQNYIYELEYGTSNFTIRTLDQIAKALKVNIRDVFPVTATAEPSSSDLKRVARTLDGLVIMVKQYMADEQDLLEREAKRRAEKNCALVSELKAITQLCESLGKLGDARKKT